MSSVRDPDEVYGRSGFSPADPASLVALLAACAACDADLRRFEFVPEIQGMLSADELQRYAAHFLERGEVFYSRVALEDWEEWLDRFSRARALMPIAVELGVAEAGCVEVLDHVIARGGAVTRALTSVPEDLNEPSDREFWPDVAPELPLRGAMLTMDLIGARARADVLLADDPSLARECLSSLLSSEVLQVFEAASRRSLADLDEDPTRDRTLMDALAIRELAGELYALMGDEEIFREIERVDAALDAPGRINALFAVAISRWRTDRDRAPSPDHWWGVRTHAEENAPALFRAFASIDGLPPRLPPGLTPAPPTAPRPSPVDPRESERRLEAIIAAAAARYAASQRAERTLPVPVAAAGSAPSSTVGAPLVWRSSEQDWFVSLKFGSNSALTDDTQLSVVVIDPPPRATRLHLAGHTLDLSASEDVLLATIRYGDLRRGARIEVVALEVEGEWQTALLDQA